MTSPKSLLDRHTDLMMLGFYPEEIFELQECSETLSLWNRLVHGIAEGYIERTTCGFPVWFEAEEDRTYPIDDNELTCLKRVTAIAEARNQRTGGIALYPYMPRTGDLHFFEDKDLPRDLDFEPIYDRGYSV